MWSRMDTGELWIAPEPKHGPVTATNPEEGRMAFWHSMGQFEAYHVAIKGDGPVQVRHGEMGFVKT